jgi:hypothetical protein
MQLLTLACLLLSACLGAAERDAGRYVRPEDAPAFAQPTFITSPPLRAYPGARYETRPAVTGGTWPYRFALRGAPTGMAIDPRSGAITWTAPQGEASMPVTVTVTDLAGRQAEQSFSLAVGAAGFVFVSPEGDDANPGTFAKPWKTVMRARQPVEDPAGTTVYLRGGTYAVDVPAAAGKKNANVLTIDKTSPRRWAAWPGEKPAIDLGWSEEKWAAALAAERVVKKEGASTTGYGHRVYIDHQVDGLVFDGLEFRNACFYMFVMWDGKRSGLTWRRCKLHHLWGDWRENSSFIFGFAADRKYEKAAPGETFPFGKRPESQPYRHIVLQECTVSDVLGEAGAGFHWYTTQGMLVEDSRFERTRGHAFMDKDNGWDNTVRNNVFKGNVMYAAQGCNDGIDFHHNFVDGDLQIGSQPGWVRNIWIHHNALRGSVVLMGGAAEVPEKLEIGERKLAGPSDPESQAIVRDFPMDRRLIHVWANAIAVRAHTDGEAPFLVRLSNDNGFANAYRHVAWNGNLVDERAAFSPGWGRTRVPWTTLKGCFDIDGASGPVAFDDEGRLPAASSWRARFGRDAGLEPQKP